MIILMMQLRVWQSELIVPERDGQIGGFGIGRITKLKTVAFWV
jgi:hypothetical protein